MGDCTAADGETDIGIGIGGEAAAHGYQQPAQSALRTRASSKCSLSMQDKARV
jgi:hypothetical protein